MLHQTTDHKRQKDKKNWTNAELTKGLIDRICTYWKKCLMRQKTLLKIYKFVQIPQIKTLCVKFREKTLTVQIHPTTSHFPLYHVQYSIHTYVLTLICYFIYDKALCMYSSYICQELNYIKPLISLM